MFGDAPSTDANQAWKKLVTTGGFNIISFNYCNFIQSATAVGEKHTTAAHADNYRVIIVERPTPTTAKNLRLIPAPDTHLH